MLQLPSKLAAYLSLLACLLTTGAPASAKCMSLQVKIEGEIAGPSTNLRVRVAVRSATKGDRVTHVSQTSSIDKSHFRVTALFDTTSNVVRHETCNREPRLVFVTLLKGTRVLDRKTLRIGTDFRRTEDGNYELVTPVVLNGRK